MKAIIDSKLGPLTDPKGNVLVFNSYAEAMNYLLTQDWWDKTDSDLALKPYRC